MPPEFVIEKILEYPFSTPSETIVEELNITPSKDLLNALRNLAVAEIQSDPNKTLRCALIIRILTDQMRDIEGRDGKSYWLSGMAHVRLNMYDQAIADYEFAKKFYEERDDIRSVCGLLLNITDALIQTAQYDQAIKLAEKAMGYATVLKEKVLMAKIEGNLVSLYRGKGQFKKALQAHKRSQNYLEASDLSDSDIETTRSDINYALVLLDLDRYYEAEKALRDMEKKYVERGATLNLARVRMNLGIMYIRQSQYQKALQVLYIAKEGFSDVKADVEVASVALFQAHAYRKLNLLDETLTHATMSAEHLKSAKLEQYLADCLRDISFAYHKLGEFTLAEDALKDAKKILGKLNLSYREYFVDMETADLAIQTNNFAHAYQIADRILYGLAADAPPKLIAQLNLIIAKTTKSDEEFLESIENAVNISEKFRFKEQKAQAYYLLAGFHKKAGDINKATSFSRLAIQEIELMRSHLVASEFRAAFVEDKLPIYQFAIDLHHKKTYEDEDAQIHLLHVLNLLQNAPLANLFEGFTDEDEKTLNEIRTDWHWFQSKLDSHNEHYNENEIASELAKAETRLSEYLRLFTSSPNFEFENDTLSTGWINDCQSRLADDEGLLYFYQSDNSIHVIIFENDHIRQTHNICSIAELEQTMSAWQFIVKQQTRWGGDRQSLQQSNKILSKLYQLLISPFSDQIYNFSHVYIVIQPHFYGIPFSALYDGERYLIERKTVTFLSSIGSLRRQVNRVENVALERKAVICACSDNNRLPSTLRESDLLYDKLSRSYEVEMLTEDMATCENFRHSVRGKSIIHVAAHAVFRRDNPNFSWIQLNNERLLFVELETLNLECKPLVAMSACETGRGYVLGGNFLSIGRSLINAGASEVIVTLWSVVDDVASNLMVKFYQVYLDKISTQQNCASHSLAEIQREAIKEELSPFFWASFVIVAG